MNNRRIEWVDIAKGIAIILMVLGHTGIPKYINDWIYSFHMPFFFFISGVLSRQYEQTDVACNIKYILHKTKVLLLPFLIYSLINIILYPLYGKLPSQEFLISLLQDGWNGIALWFIPVFFVCVVICYFCSGTNKSIYISMPIFLMIGAFLSYRNIKLPYALSTVPIGCFYIMLGSTFKRSIFYIIDQTTLPIKTILLIGGFVISFIISLHYRLDLASNNILPLTPLLLAAICGIISICIISKLVEHIKFTRILLYSGRHTYEIMAFSQVIVILANEYFQSINPILKYLILLLCLYMVCHIIDYIKKECILTKTKNHK